MIDPRPRCRCALSPAVDYSTDNDATDRAEDKNRKVFMSNDGVWQTNKRAKDQTD